MITMLPFGTVVDIQGAATGDGWYPAGAQGATGFVNGLYLDFTAPPPLQGDALVSPADGLHLHQAASISSDVVATLPAGRLVHLLGDSTTDGWQHVSALEGIGWVAGSYLQPLAAGAVPVLVRWYGHEFDGGVLACGGVYSADDPTVAATNGWPCGTKLQVCASGRCVMVTVRDRGGMAAGEMDVSMAAFQKLAPLGAGALAATLQIATDSPAAGAATPPYGSSGSSSAP